MEGVSAVRCVILSVSWPHHDIPSGSKSIQASGNALKGRPPFPLIGLLFGRPKRKTKMEIKTSS
eukprot:scaffold12364_cov113-Skeletonema_marinoi.AAC.2